MISVIRCQEHGRMSGTIELFEPAQDILTSPMQTQQLLSSSLLWSLRRGARQVREDDMLAAVVILLPSGGSILAIVHF